MNLHLPLSTLLALGLGSALAAQEILVTSDITTSTTWTASNRYNLQGVIYVTNGATLTIQAGTVIASTNGLEGTLAVTRGSKIFSLGTERNPVIFTSTGDYNTWTGGDPKTGTWRPIANEWGNVTVMGNAYISENLNPNTNSATPNASNYGTMEGLVAAFPGDSRLFYGGGNDDDDSGSILYTSIRYTGKVVGLSVERNGLALGGVGRETDIAFIDVMNGLDDGIEIWGGTVNLKYLNIWNVGDDSFDVDQGWRGKMQFGLIVQGFSTPAAQGSGWGDNCFEMDGAERSDYQPVTTSTIYNCTVIGAPQIGGTGGCDQGTAWRDNARVQFRNSIFMDLGEKAVSFENDGGEGTGGYGLNGTLSWDNTWTTAYNNYSPVNAPANPAAFYPVQASGNLIEFSDNVFYNNNHTDAYTEANLRSVFAPANNNVQASSMPITSMTRGAPQTVSGLNQVARVIAVDPTPANDALVSVSRAPADGFFTPARYRGAFAPGNNWLVGWTAADAYGFVTHNGWTDLGNASDGITGAPVMDASGTGAAGTSVTYTLANAKPVSLGLLLFGFSRADLPLAGFGFPGVVLVPNFNTFGYVVVFTDPSGNNTLNVGPIPAGFSGAAIYNQYLIFETPPLAASNAVYRTFL